MTDLIERICHREQLSIWAGELSSALALSDFLKEDWSFDDSVDLEKELVAQLRDIIRSALTHPEINLIERLQELLDALKLMQAEADAADAIGYGWGKARQQARDAIVKAEA